jgi:thiosulfate dehydrogenase [quinone] large subunit
MPIQSTTRRPQPTGRGDVTPPAALVGRQWGQLRLRQAGWMILPLRGFLGVTFVYAGLQKLANPAYLDPHSPTSVTAQMTQFRHTSPIGPLLGLSLHAPTAVGLLIAFGELAVGLGALLGLFTRFAAVGGMLLALTFFLTVSWSTTPYYYGSDIVFVFAWSALAGLGSGDVLSLDGWLHSRARADLGAGETSAAYLVAASRLKASCDRDRACGLSEAAGCAAHACPLFGPEDVDGSDVAQGIARRQLIFGSRAAVVVGVVALATGGTTALLGRLLGGSSSAPSTAQPPPSPRRRRSPQPKRSHASQGSGAAAPPSVAIGSASSVPVHHAAPFKDPATGGPAWLIHTAANQFTAFSAVCTHAGCTVNFDPGAMELVCPCHGGTFDVRTGQVVAGPPPQPLPAIPVHVVNGTVRVG